MIYLGKSPYRVSLLGGGSDLSWFVRENNYGLCLGFSLNRYSYSVINLLPDSYNHGILDYSVREVYSSLNDIAHPIIRETLKSFNIEKFVEIKSFGFAGGGAGLGGSASFLLSLMAAINLAFKIDLNLLQMIEKACEIEIDVLKKPIGKQDQYLCSESGINSYTFRGNNTVTKNLLSKEKIETLHRAVENMYLIPTNKYRKSDNVLSSVKNDSNSAQKILEIRNIAEAFINSKEERDYKIENIFNQSMQDSWRIKKDLPLVMNQDLNDQMDSINKLIPNNWIRLIGAGSGGYFLVSSKISEKEIKSISENKAVNGIFKASLSETGVESFSL